MSELDDSEFGKPSFNEMDPEIQISVYRFDQERRELYDWLALKVRRNIDVYTYNGEAGNIVCNVSERFTESALEIRQRLEEPEIATFLISDSWSRDEEERNKRFSNLMVGTQFDLIERPWVDQAVSDVFRQTADSEKAFIKDLHKLYADSLTCDVVKLLNTVHTMQEKDIIAKVGDLPLTRTDSRHQRASAPMLKRISQAYAIRALLKNDLL